MLCTPRFLLLLAFAALSNVASGMAVTLKAQGIKTRSQMFCLPTVYTHTHIARKVPPTIKSEQVLKLNSLLLHPAAPSEADKSDGTIDQVSEQASKSITEMLYSYAVDNRQKSENHVAFFDSSHGSYF